ncbi:MAG: hypothetical protein ACYC2H_04785 [Thermoplasmatota archaeon]
MAVPSWGLAFARLGSPHWGWLASAAVLGFLLSWTLADLAGLERQVFLVAYVLAVGALAVSYLRWSGMSLAKHAKNRPLWGLIAAIVAGAIGAWNVYQQPGEGRASGGQLALEVLWDGLAYGAADATLLTVIPMLAVLAALQRPTWDSKGRRVTRTVLMVVASLAVAAIYHAGYAEFRGPDIGAAVVGNALFALAYLFSRSPIGPVLGHVIMHVAAVLHGPDQVVQLPPH